MQNGGPEMLLVILPTGTGQRNHSTAHWAEGGKGMEKPQVSKWTLCTALFTWKETSEIGRHYFPPILNSFSTLLINFSIQIRPSSFLVWTVEVVSYMFSYLHFHYLAMNSLRLYSENLQYR